MISRRLITTGRIPLLRLLRPPGPALQQPRPRHFTQNTPLLLVASRNLRPQLSYLAQPAFQGPVQRQLGRLLSTESRKFVRDTAILSTKAALISTFLAICAVLITTGVRIEGEERRNPTPEEWRFWTREYMREARRHLDAGRNGNGIVNWGRIGSRMGRCLVALEDPEHEGKGLENSVTGGEQHLIDGIGQSGYDISAKSPEWRDGYFEVCMNCASVAEHMETSVVDKTRSMVFPKEVVIGPSNPDPRPTPPYMAATPLEENCRPAYPAPETFYMRILTSTGFSTKQRVDAASAYATWLEYKGLAETAEEMYKWAVDIAKAGLAVPADTIMDPQTAVLNEQASSHSSINLLRATTNLATHYARNGNVSSALPILLSVLRARRTALVSPLSPQGEGNDFSTEHVQQSSGIGSTLASWGSFLKPPRPSTSQVSDDAPFIRKSEQPTCEESELMLYIGEILFATGPQSNEGLSWTRQGVTIANANLQKFEKEDGATKLSESLFGLLFPTSSEPVNAEEEKCKDCLFIGVQNWETMLRQITDRLAIDSPREGGGWMSWLGKTGNDGDIRSQLERELGQVAQLKDKIVREGIAEEMFKVKGSTAGTWIG